MTVGRYCICFVLLTVLPICNCYEKTLRKMIRSQSKMVQRPLSESTLGSQSKMVERPFSDSSFGSQSKIVQRSLSESTLGDTRVYSRKKTSFDSDTLMFSGYQMKKVHKLHPSKISSGLSQSNIDHGTLPSLSEKNISTRIGSSKSLELRLTRDIFKNSSTIPRNGMNAIFKDHNNANTFFNQTDTEKVSVNNFYVLPAETTSKAIRQKIKAKIPNSAETGTAVDSIIISNTPVKAPDDSIVISSNTPVRTPGDSIVISSSIPANNTLVKSVFISNSKKGNVHIQSKQEKHLDPSDFDNDRVDYLIEEKPVASLSNTYKYDVSLKTYTCRTLNLANADINTAEKFNILDIEPRWAPNKHYWNSIYDSRYESLMRKPKWPPLKVILVPRTEVNSIWKMTFQRNHNDTVHSIISNIVKKLQFYSNLTFSWNEVSHLAQWWTAATPKSRLVFRRLLKQGRLEIAAGGWVETDEATSHIFGLVHQFIEGQQWLKNHLNYSPEVAWFTSSVSHSPTVAYLLSASGIENLVLTNLHYSWEEFLAEYQYSDFIWIQNWKSENIASSSLNTKLGRIGIDRLPSQAVLTHFMQFNSADFNACGPNQSVCAQYFKTSSQKHEVLSFNIKEKAEALLEQYSKAGTISAHNTIIAPIGTSNYFNKQAAFDYQYNYYQTIANYVNLNQNIYKATIEFGTAKDYFNTILSRYKAYPTLKGDFANYADLRSGTPAYWVGYFTSRPWFKILLRRVQSVLRSTEIIFTFAVNFNKLHGFNASNMYQMLLNAREFTARLQDRHVVGGTLTVNALKYIYKQILMTIKNCWYIQEMSASFLSLRPDKVIKTPYLQKYAYRDGEFVSLFKSVGPDDQVFIFNSLSHERTETIELTVRNPNVRVFDNNKKEVTIQINPVWKYSTDNVIRISKLFYKIVFVVVIPPLTLELFRLKATSDNSLNVATIYCTDCIVEDLPGEGPAFPFRIQPVQPGDIQLESYKHRLVIDERTGFLKKVLEKKTGIEKSVIIDYGAFRSSSVNSGMFLFNTNVSKPLRDILLPYRIGLKSKVILIAAGQVSTELTSIFGRTLQSTIRIFNLVTSPLSNAIYIESKVDYELSPKNREVELFISMQTNIDNGNPLRMFTDNNGFQYSTRYLNISRRIESNVYPMTTMSYIQDRESRLTFITDHAQAVTALQEGQLVVILDRRVLYDDERGSNEGLADSSATVHRNYILLENFVDSSSNSNDNLQMPSLSAVQLASALDNSLDIFVVDRRKLQLAHYAFIPLVKTSFPCDISLVNFRVNFEKGSQQNLPSTGLMILHRHSISCFIDYDINLNCNGDETFYILKIFNHIKYAFKTNLSGTAKGIAVSSLNRADVPPMELVTLRIIL